MARPVQLFATAIVTDSSGDFALTLQAQSGRLLQYRYKPDGTSPLAAGAGITLSGAASGLSLIAQSNIGASAFTKAPRQPTHTLAGTALVRSTGGDEPVSDYVWIGGEQLSLAVSSGGAAKAGTLYLWIE